MKSINVVITFVSLIMMLLIGNMNGSAQTKPAAPILDKDSEAKIATGLNTLGAEVSLHDGSYIYKMDSTVVASAATGDYAVFISKVLGGIKFEYSSPKYLSPIAIQFSGSDCLVFRYATSSVYNENKFSDRELAQRICSDMILPDLYRLSDAFEINCPKYVGIGVAYTTKDFTEKYDLGDIHSLVIISSKDNIKKLLSYELTDNKFLDKSFILLYKGTNGKRIELQF